MSTLVIVESPAKAKTIKKYLGPGYEVVASMGHVRDLPAAKLSVDVKNGFTPKYAVIKGKEKLVSELKKDVEKSDKVILATDPDREGEAIAWHLSHILEIPENSNCRVTFNEITKETVKESIKKPRTINMDLVDAQQARRVLDRIVGYKISPVLWKKVKRGLSAGRVQSVAVKLIVDREEEIEKFIPEEYWNIYANLLEPNSDKNFQATLYGKDNKKIEIHTKEEVDEILKNIEKGKYIVSDVKKGEKKRTPASPFTTSTMQQEASRKLSFTLKKTMSVAQGLYEGVHVGEKGTVGLITYMRTDSTRISDEARAKAKEVITQKYGENYYENRYYKTKQNAQDAHEAIRPTYIDLEPEKIKDFLTTDQYKLYRLIYNRFIASQMSNAIYDTVTANIDVNNYNFKASGQTLKFKGFMTLYVETLEDEKEEEVWKLSKSILFTVLGLVMIIVGSDFVVDAASFLAKEIGISERIISLTIIALGTSLPELVTSVMATKKGEYDIAIGNVVGSNIFNIGIVIGLPVTILGGISKIAFSYIDLIVMIGAALLLFIFSRNDYKIKKSEGIAFLIIFVIYYSYVILG